jgi:hypothetical protein
MMTSFLVLLPFNVVASAWKADEQAKAKISSVFAMFAHSSFFCLPMTWHLAFFATSWMIAVVFGMSRFMAVFAHHIYFSFLLPFSTLFMYLFAALGCNHSCISIFSLGSTNPMMFCLFNEDSNQVIWAKDFFPVTFIVVSTVWIVGW